ncbi:MAG: nitrile hydratase subunit beta [Alphaproteobacteria bacterium]|nr:nitrile hydratase subunit beta [Alphaproteobacteria bacterium]
MNGAHDLGGVDGFGPVVPEPERPVFHHAWEKRAFAITLACGFLGRWNIDMARFAREDTDPLTYLKASYYQTWLRGLERLLVEKNLVSAAELTEMKSRGTSDARMLPADSVAKVLAKGGPARRPDPPGAPRFRAGQSVRTKNIHPRGHTRLPRYCRGKQGIVRLDHGTQVFPDSNARGAGENPQRCYAVEFAAGELWGPGADPTLSVMVDLWDDYLEAA